MQIHSLGAAYTQQHNRPQQIQREQQTAPKAPAEQKVDLQPASTPDRVEKSLRAAAQTPPTRVETTAAIRPANRSIAPVATAKTVDHSPPNPTPDSAEPNNARRVYTSADKEALLEAWGSAAGDRSYSQDYDLNSDGRIGAADLAALLANYTEQAPSNTPSLDGIKQAWGIREGEQGYSASNDLNSDGVVDARDLAQFLGSQRTEDQSQTSSPQDAEAVRQERLQDLLSRFGSRVGDESFTSAFDFDGDGQIGPADLAAFLSDWNEDDA